jgi:hypothetical protein
MLPIFSCPRAALDLGHALAERQFLIINTRKSRFGANVSDFVGSLVINI